MAPPRIPGGRGGGRGRGKGGYKGRMGKNFRKNPDGSDKPKGKARRSGLGMWGVGLIATAIAGLVALVAHREKAALEKESEAVRRRLRRNPRGFSEHAVCRMDCRFIGEDEAMATLRTGKLSARHSTPNARPCPRWALEDGRVRAVWAECRDETRLVTVIDTVTDHPCGPC